jgi:hypothetical protein
MRHLDSKRKEFYHASPKQFKPGDYLAPNLPDYSANYNSSQSKYIYLTPSPKPHYTIADKAIAENWNVYKVVLTNPKRIWVGMWDDYITDRPCVVEKLVGSARGISKAGRPSKNNRELENEQWYKDKLKEAKEALTSDELRKQFEEFWDTTVEERIKELQNKIKYKNYEHSMVPYKPGPSRRKY